MVELERSLAPYVLVYDERGELLAGSATLHGRAPVYPAGALATARSRGSNRVTWQPEPGVRSATVVIPWRDGTVVAGRSLREEERRVEHLQMLVGALWLAVVVGTAVAALVASLTYVMLTAPPYGAEAVLTRASWDGGPAV
jgi:hypothetical protein